MNPAANDSSTPFDLTYRDSVILRASCYPTERRLSLHVELCGFMQDGAADSDPEIIPGTLVFYEVSEPSFDPPDALTSWSADTDGEILRLDATEVARGHQVVLVFKKEDYSPQRTQVCVINLVCSRAEWKPDSHRLSGAKLG
jgi:hypothetical protein